MNKIGWKCLKFKRTLKTGIEKVQLKLQIVDKNLLRGKKLYKHNQMTVVLNSRQEKKNCNRAPSELYNMALHASQCGAQLLTDFPWQHVWQRFRSTKIRVKTTLGIHQCTTLRTANQSRTIKICSTQSFLNMVLHDLHNAFL